MLERLVERLVAVGERGVLADDRDGRLVVRPSDGVEEALPRGHLRLGAPHAELREQALVHALVVQPERDGVDGVGVRRGDHVLDVHVAEARDLALDAVVDVAVGAADQDVRLDADRAQLAHRVLGRLRLELTRGGDPRHERDVDVRCVGLALVGEHLAHGLEEGQRLDVADRAADLREEDVDVVRSLLDAEYLISSVM